MSEQSSNSKLNKPADSKLDFSSLVKPKTKTEAPKGYMNSRGSILDPLEKIICPCKIVQISLESVTAECAPDMLIVGMSVLLKIEAATSDIDKIICNVEKIEKSSEPQNKNEVVLLKYENKSKEFQLKITAIMNKLAQKNIK